jgi:hypothetical protein
MTGSITPLALRTAKALQPTDIRPQVSPPFSLTESQKEKHAESMTDAELVAHVENKLRPLGDSLRSNIAYLREARDRYAHPGRRVPVFGQPTFTKWIRQNLGISDRHVRRLLAAPKEKYDGSSESVMESSPKQEKRDELLWRANRIAHAVLGLHEPDERDSSAVNRKATLTAMAHEFLNLAGRKHIRVVVRLKELRPADIHGLCRVIMTCFEMQLDQVFKPLAEEDLREALRLFTQEIANRYDG